MKKTWNIKYYLAGSVALITLLVYLPALQNDFVDWDDGIYVFDNPYIRTLDTAFLKWAFFESHKILWHPLTWISHALDYAVWELNPLGHHLSNILFHGLNTMLVVLLATGLIEVWGATYRGVESEGSFAMRGKLVVGAITGLLFGLHPLHVESVAWVTERKDVLYAFFFLLSLLSYMRYVKTVDDTEGVVFKDRRYLSVMGFFLLALLSKPMAITLPLVLLILDWFPARRFEARTRRKKIILEKIPFFVFSLLPTLIIVIPNHFAAVSMTMHIPFSTRILVAGRALISYLGKMLWPADLVQLYPYPQSVSVSSPAYFIPLLSVIAITIVCGVLARRRKLWISVWAIYFVTLLPVLGLVPFGPHAMADRYTYLPSVGPFLILALGGAWVWEKARTLKRGLSARIFCAAAACALLLALSTLTFKQIGIWKNSFVLWNNVVEKEPGAALAYLHRGIAFDNMGQTYKAKEDIDMAITLDPGDYEAYISQGILYSKTGRYDKAMEAFTKSIAIKPNYLAYYNRGFSYAFAGQYDRALDDLNKAIYMNDNFDIAYVKRGELYDRTGNKVLAHADFRKACDLGNESGCNALHQLTQGLNPE